MNLEQSIVETIEAGFYTKARPLTAPAQRAPAGAVGLRQKLTNKPLCRLLAASIRQGRRWWQTPVSVELRRRRPCCAIPPRRSQPERAIQGCGQQTAESCS